MAELKIKQRRSRLPDDAFCLAVRRPVRSPADRMRRNAMAMETGKISRMRVPKTHREIRTPLLPKARVKFATAKERRKPSSKKTPQIK